MPNGGPEIPPEERPVWAHDLKLYTYWMPKIIYGDDPTEVKTWDLGNWKIRWGFEDWTDYDYNDFVLVTEDLGDGRLKITVESCDASATADLYWKEELVLADLLNNVGVTIIVTGIPPRAKVVELYDSIMAEDKIIEPPDYGGYWILGYWVRKVRPKWDKIKADDHNIPRLVLRKARDLAKEAEEGTV